MKKSPSKKVTKKILEGMPLHNDAEVKRYIGFVTESHRDEIKVVAENVKGLEERMDRGFNEVNKRLDTHEQILSRHELLLHEHTKKLNSHSEMIGRLLVDGEEIKSGMKQKIDREEFTKLEKRMVALEAFVFSGRGKQKARK